MGQHYSRRILKSTFILIRLDAELSLLLSLPGRELNPGSYDLHLLQRSGPLGCIVPSRQAVVKVKETIQLSKNEKSAFYIFSGTKFTGFGSKSDADVTKSHERVIFF